MKQLLFLFIAIVSFYDGTSGDTTNLNTYRNRILQVFNQSTLLDSQVIGAIKIKSPQDIENARIKLLDYVGYAMKLLDTIGNFEDDASLKFSCRDVLLFYKQLAENDLPLVRNYFATEQYFLNYKREFDKKKVKKHTEAEILAYNVEAKRYNEALTNYTLLNTFMESARKQTLYNWNTSEQIFLKSHLAKS